MCAFLVFSELGWHKVIALFINPGVLDENLPWLPQLFLALIGFVLFTVLISSIITAWITNINANIREGRRRYRLSGHVIIFGSGDQLDNILASFLNQKKRVLVVSANRPGVKYDNFIYYKGERDDPALIAAACPGKATEIYIIGDDNEPGHDSRSLKCLELLNAATKNSKGKPIHCFITFDDEETTEIYQYLRGDAGKLSSRLYLVDAINEYEYQAEQFLLNTDVLPVISNQSAKKAHFILIGADKVSQAMAYTLAHACHYPKYKGQVRKTCITIIDRNAFEMRDNLLLARPYLFEESVYESISKDGKAIVHRPERDILDIEWRFVEGTVADKQVNSLLKGWVEDENLENRLMVCDMKSSRAIPDVLHLPSFVYGKIPLSVYLEDSVELIKNANNTMMYGGRICVFGPASEYLSDPLLKRRSECGQRVNFVYEMASMNEGKKQGSPIKAWYARCEADKLSSIYCAIGLPLREKIFNIDNNIEDIYEIEHRRWMMSEYLMGFRYGPQRDKTLFTHKDLVAYEDLPAEEKDKDRILIDNRHYILTGEGDPVINR